MVERRESTESDYRGRMHDVLGYIQAHLDEAISPADLAGVACFAPHHFHRVFKGMVGETIMEYIRRLRLERAAWRLKFTDESVTSIAFGACYETHEAFSRAFRRRFDTSPSAFRETHQRLVYPGSPSGSHYKGESGGVEFRVEARAEGAAVVRMEERRAVYVRHVGAYQECKAAWDTLMGWAAGEGLIGPGCDMYGLCHDDPHVTPAERIRYDACLVVARDVEVGGEVGMTVIPGGDYVVQRHVGSYELLTEAYDRLFGIALPHFGRMPEPGACVERYWNDPDSTAVEELETDVCVRLID